MATEQQIAASRPNPQTAEAANDASRIHGLRHGITAQIEVATSTEKEAKDRFFDGFISDLAPIGVVESQFAHSIADAHWRLNRASAIENNIFTIACSFQAAQAESIRSAAGPDAADSEDPEVEKALDAARVFIEDPKRFQLITIYEGRIHRTMMNNLRILNQMQTTRRALEARQKEEAEAKRAKALEEACLLTQLAEMEGVSYDPATDFPGEIGFTPTKAEIAHAIHRETRLQTARNAQFANDAQAQVGCTAKSSNTRPSKLRAA